MTNGLSRHLEQMQQSAYVAESLVRVIVRCGDNPARVGLIITAAEAALTILGELGVGLDSVILEKMVQS